MVSTPWRRLSLARWAPPARSRPPRAVVIPAAGLALAGLLAGAVTAQGAAAADGAPRTRDAACASLAALALARRGLISASAQVVAASGMLPAYCDVKLEERPAINIEVALPLSGSCSPRPPPHPPSLPGAGARLVPASRVRIWEIRAA